jgi:hypothetical protein
MTEAKERPWKERWDSFTKEEWEVEIETQIHEANINYQEELRKGPYATGLTYDSEEDLIVVKLSNDCIFSFPPSKIMGLKDADEYQLSEGVAEGLNIVWYELEVDLLIRELLVGNFPKGRTQNVTLS